MTPGRIISLAKKHVLPTFALDPKSDVHGWPHWARVWQNAQKLVAMHMEPADLEVCCWFAFLHDSQRRNDNDDPFHGHRAAAFAYSLYEKGVIKLTDGQLYTLQFALCMHSGAVAVVDMTASICWDADKLDLPRVGIVPSPYRMCTKGGEHFAQQLQKEHHDRQDNRQRRFLPYFPTQRT